MKLQSTRSFSKSSTPNSIVTRCSPFSCFRLLDLSYSFSVPISDLTAKIASNLDMNTGSTKCETERVVKTSRQVKSFTVNYKHCSKLVPLIPLFRAIIRSCCCHTFSLLKHNMYLNYSYYYWQASFFTLILLIFLFIVVLLDPSLIKKFLFVSHLFLYYFTVINGSIVNSYIPPLFSPSKFVSQFSPTTYSIRAIPFRLVHSSIFFNVSFRILSLQECFFFSIFPLKNIFPSR